jgi:hypothetical protein
MAASSVMSSALAPRSVKATGMAFLDRLENMASGPA